VAMEMVDTGCGVDVGNKLFSHQSNKSYCNKKGFYDYPHNVHSKKLSINSDKNNGKNILE
jgi:hypothetical protein